MERDREKGIEREGEKKIERGRERETQAILYAACNKAITDTDSQTNGAHRTSLI